MKLALRELLRRPSRFITASVILTLIAVLLMFLGGLLDGLSRTATGALRAQDVDAIVYSDTAQASFLRSRIDPATRAAIEGIYGVSDTGGLGVVLLGARVPGNGPRELANTAVWGYELAQKRLPEPPPPGTAWADEILRADGVEVGDELLIGPARTPITVRGWVADRPTGVMADCGSMFRPGGRSSTRTAPTPRWPTVCTRLSSCAAATRTPPASSS